jgi:hypothetical protein
MCDITNNIMKKKEYKAPEIQVELISVESNILTASNAPQEIELYDGNNEEEMYIIDGFID